MSLKKYILSSTGSGLMTVMVAMAAVGGIGVIMMAKNDESNKSMKSNFITEEMNSMTAQMARLLSSSQACGLTFNNLNAKNSIEVTELKDHTGMTVLSTDTKFGTTGVSFESITLRDRNVPDDEVQVVTGGEGSTYVEVKFNKMDKSLFSQKNKIVKIRLNVITDASDRVTDCFAINASDTLWAVEAGNNINYSPGNVGIGLDTPTEKLDVSGASYTPTKRLAVAATTSDGKKFGVGGIATEYQMNVNDDLPIVVKSATGPQRGTIVVNKASASQSFILEPVSGSGVPCVSNLEGAIRSKEIVIRPVATRGQNAQTLLRTQVCSNFGGVWKWRTLKVQKFTRSSGALCTPSQSSKDCTDHNNNPAHQ